MAQSKDRHYWSQLRLALIAGLWSSPTPAKTPKGQGLSWHELLRKFKKHVHGHDEVASVASQTQLLALSLANDVESSSSKKSLLSLGSESILPKDRRGDATTGLTTLKTLEKSNLNSLLLLLAYYSYAVDQPSECLLYLSKVADLGDVESHIPMNTPSSARTDGNSSSLQAPSANGRPDSVASFHFIQGVDEGRSWALTEAVRSYCLKGMSHEKLSPTEPEIALDAYCAALPLLATVESEIPRAIPPKYPGDFTCFDRFRELWIWVDRLLWRAVTLAAQTCLIDDVENGRLWKLLSHYRMCSAYWPPKFNTEHRSAVATLHLRALHIRARIFPPPPPSMQALGKPPAWVGEARAVVNDYRAILTVSTHFPRAGERNAPVEDFVDLSVAIWEAGGAVGDQAGWVIDILWWATRLTFNSYRIFRHMTRLFYATGDTQLARRTLKLYIQVVGKAYEAEGAGVALDADSDRHWVETLTHGARMLCRMAGPTGIEEAREAGKLIEKAKKRLQENDKDLVATVHLAEGVWSATTAMVEHDSRMRASRMAHALAKFAASVKSYPTPSGYYHLAIALARPGPQQNLEEAVTNAGLAVEGASQDIRFWHLLGLLLTAQGKWKEAKSVLEIGAAIGDDGEDDNDSNEDAPEDGVQVRDFDAQPSGSINGTIPNGHAHPPEVNDSYKTSTYLLKKNSTTIPLSASLLQPLPDHPSPSRQDIFEHALQLRMTQLAVSENINGAEGAGLKWVEVFGWVARREGHNMADHRRSSIDTARNSEETRQHSEYAETNAHGTYIVSSEKGVLEEPHNHRENFDLPPIMVTPATPATPADPNPPFLSEEKRSDSIDRESTGKKVQQLVKDRVQKSQAKISTVSKKIGRGMVKSPSLRRASSAPDLQALLAHKPYQASSIHSRRRMSFIRHTPAVPIESLSPPPPPPPTLSPDRKDQKSNRRGARDNRLLSDLWLQSAATFRRLGKIEQAKGAIQEGEVKDEDNPAVWVQLGLYYMALGHRRDAITAFHKALFIAPEEVSATVHLCRLYLTPQKRPKNSHGQDDLVIPGNVDLASGMLSYAVRGPAWDVPEAWYFLAKAYGLQGRKDKEREALTLALSLSEQRTVRDIGLAVGWCL